MGWLPLVEGLLLVGWLPLVAGLLLAGLLLAGLLLAGWLPLLNQERQTRFDSRCLVRFELAHW